NDGPLPPYGARTCGAGSETPPAPHIPIPGVDVNSFLLTLYRSAMYYPYHSARFEPGPLPGTNPGGGRKIFRPKTRLSCPGDLKFRFPITQECFHYGAEPLICKE